MTRRAVIASFGAGSLALAGCGALPANPEGVRISHMSFENHTDSERTVQYQVESEDRILIDGGVTLGRHKDADQYYQDRERRVHEALHQQAVYTIRYRLASDGDWRRSHTFDGEDWTCLGVVIAVREAGVSLYTGEVPENQCPTASTTSNA